MKNNKLTLLLLAIMASAIFFLLVSFCLSTGWFLLSSIIPINRDKQLGTPMYSIGETSENFNLLWETSDLVTTIPTNRSNLTAVSNKLYLITEGPDENSPTTLSLVAMNAYSGEIERRTDGEFGTEIAHNQQFLFIQNQSGISAFTLDTGEHVWSIKPPGARGIEHMTATNADLFLTATPDETFILDTINGEIKEEIDLSSIASSLFFVKDSIVYWQQWPSYLIASDIESGEVIWDKSFEGGFKKTPIFAGTMIFVVTHGGHLLAIDRNSGDILWNTNKPDTKLHPDRVVSNIAIDNGILYYLTQDAQLRALNAIDGTLIDEVRFSPSLFELGERVNSYRFDVAAHNGIVAVHFGDSFQLFTFKFQEND